MSARRLAVGLGERPRHLISMMPLWTEEQAYTCEQTAYVRAYGIVRAYIQAYGIHPSIRHTSEHTAYIRAYMAASTGEHTSQAAQTGQTAYMAYSIDTHTHGIQSIQS
jgi:hypothetical protein